VCYLAKVCAVLAEVWCLFRMTNFSKTGLEGLGYWPNAHVLQKFWELCQQQLNVPGNSSKYAYDGGLFILCFSIFT